MEKSAASSHESHASLALSPLHVWALSFGGIIGWGSFIMPGTMFLPNAGPMGTVIAMFLAGLVMLIIGANFCAVGAKYPDNGGIFSYTKNILGHDHAFFAAWALGLAYLSLIWSNATAFSLLARYLFGDVLQWGFHYRIAGYDVFGGEVLLTMMVIAFFWLLSRHGGAWARNLHAVLAAGLFAIVLVLFAVLWPQTDPSSLISPAFHPNFPPEMQVLSMFMLAPWMFVGFEAVTHSAEDFSFPVKKLYPTIVWAVLAGVLTYSLLTCMAALAVPAPYGSWVHYVGDLANLRGVLSLPTFHSVWSAVGITGVWCLGVAIVCALATSLLGFYRAASHLIASMAQDSLLPEKFGQRDAHGIPQNALTLIMAISLIAPFLGRTSISWLTDVTTIGASIAYGYVSLASYRLARDSDNRLRKTTGMVGVAVSVFFFFCPILPNFLLGSSLTSESYVLLAIWSIGGFFYYWYVFKHDRRERFGKSTAMCIMVLFMAFFSTAMWVRQATEELIENTLGAENAVAAATLTKHSMIQMGLIMLILFLMSNLFTTMREREKKLAGKILQAEEVSRAKTAFLSNMSHDIRTPMNAIIGYIELSKKTRSACDDCTREKCDKAVPKKLQDFMDKIEVASGQLLSIINDVLEMSRIESGKMELNNTPTDLIAVLEEIKGIFEIQMREKGIDFNVDRTQVTHNFVNCDGRRLNRVLLNLLSNAYKFTDKGGTVSVVLRETGTSCVMPKETYVDYELRVKDSGIGMSEEFAKRIFNAFERERTSTVSGIQGTGLGMSITKSIVDLMGGTIRVLSKAGEGTEFFVSLTFAAAAPPTVRAPADADTKQDFAKKRLLLVDDIDVNREIATMLLEDAGFRVEAAQNGREAVDMVAASPVGHYDAVLMDIQMPVMDGYAATKEIRRLENAKLANIPILAMTANAFDEDRKAAVAAGMNGHIAKPLDVANLFATLGETLTATEKGSLPKKTYECIW